LAPLDFDLLRKRIVRQGRTDSPWEALQDRVFLGGVDFIGKLKKEIRQAFPKDDRPAWSRERISVETIIQGWRKQRKNGGTDFKDRYRDGGLALVLMMARRFSGLTLAELARRIELRPTVNISMTLKRHQQRLLRDRAERKLASLVEKMINDTI
jgi:hypothetical protein